MRKIIDFFQFFNPVDASPAEPFKPSANVLRSYAQDIDRHGEPMDSDLAPYLRKTADYLECSPNLTEDRMAPGPVAEAFKQLWDVWYGEHRGKMSAEQMAMLLNETRESITSYYHRPREEQKLAQQMCRVWEDEIVRNANVAGGVINPALEHEAAMRAVLRFLRHETAMK